MYEVIVGRSEADRKALGLTGTIYLGKMYVKMGAVTSLSNKVYMDVAHSHVVFISGKRGTGKCLTGDAKVTLEDGKKIPIEKLKNIREGVLSINSNLKIIKTKKTEFFTRKVKTLIEFTTKKGKKIKLTPEHPLLTKKGWIETQKLKIGSEIAAINKNKVEWEKIISMKLLEGNFKVYDISVPEHHNFIANDIIVHNSYTMGVMAEEMANLPTEIANRLAVLIIDTMGIYWTMKFPNEKDEDLLREWDLPKKGLNVQIYTPAGFYKQHKEKGIPTDFPFTIQPSELDSSDWAGAFGVSLLENLGIAIDRTVARTKERYGNTYSIDSMITTLRTDEQLEYEIRLALENRLLAAKSWGLFDIEGTPLKRIIAGGQTTVLDISCYTNWTIKCLVLGIICRRLMLERMQSRKEEELEDVEKGHSYFKTTVETKEGELPIVWIMIDEAHEFLPKDYKTLATDSLVAILREGRQPGVCLVLVSQQPGQIHRDVLTQTDIIICHRITAKRDVEALNSMMQAYTTGDIQKYLNQLPTDLGSAVLLDDNSERMYAMRTHPRFTWHGGEAPTAVKPKSTSLEKLGL